MRSPIRALAVLSLAAAAGCAQTSPYAGAYADRVYTGGPIHTMLAGQERVDFLAVRGGSIQAIGTGDVPAALLGPQTQRVDLAGRALLPGFIDAHGHLTHLARFAAMANVASPPVGPVKNIAELQAELRAYIEANAVPAGTWVIGTGYDDALLAERRHPTRADLDNVSREHPILLLHVSLHLASANSAALERAGVTAETPNLPAGIFRRMPGSNEPNGVLEEHAMWAVFGTVPQPTLEQGLALLEAAQRKYASHGFTTLQDGASGAADFALLRAAADRHMLFLDVTAYAMWREMDAVANHAGAPVGRYADRLKLGGAKLVLDGSPQGKTAWLSQPFHVPPDGQGADYAGYPAMQDEELLGFLRDIRRRAWPLLAHANGDAAAEQVVRGVEQVVAESGPSDWRPVMIHAQMVRTDQLERMLPLGMLPSFFVAHTFYWGDWHRDSVMGPERAARMSPAQTAHRLGLHFTIHNDAPVVPPDSMRLVWAAVNRVTRSGAVIGPDERLTPEQALRALTLDAAYQNFEEDRKGSLEPGKLADLVILSASPFDVEPMAIRDIQIVETLKEGRSVYRAAAR